jgi:hypothetical protein
MRLTEEEWSTAVDPWRLLLRQWPRKTTDRKFALFAVACWRQIWNLINEESRRAIEALEEFADLAPERQRPEDWEAIRDAVCPLAEIGAESEQAGWNPERAAREATSLVTWLVLSPAESSILEQVRYEFEGAALDSGEAVSSAWRARACAHCELLRHVVGDPFHHPPVVPSHCLEWNGGTVPAIALGIYRDRVFGEMPILADALEDAGCTDAQILDHCRAGGDHMRGCWALDLVLGRHYLA